MVCNAYAATLQPSAAAQSAPAFTAILRSSSSPRPPPAATLSWKCVAGGRPGNLGMWKLITASRSPTLSSSSAGDAVAASERSATAAAAGRAPLPAPCAGSGQLALTRTRNRAVMLVRMALLQERVSTISLKRKVKMGQKRRGKHALIPPAGFPAPNPPEAPPQPTLLAQCIRLHMVHMVKHVWLFCLSYF